MARSAEALQRRALKRNRTVQEQQKADARSVKRARPSPLEQRNGSTKSKSQQQANNENVVSDEGKVAQKISSNSTSNNITKKQQRHDPETSKVIVWSKPQASEQQIQDNQTLRQRLLANDPTMTSAELERARILVARDERRKKKQQSKSSKPVPKKKDDNDNATEAKEEAKPAELQLSSKQQGKANKLLLKKYKKTNGEGMTPEQVTRVEQLLERKIRKLAKQQQQQPAQQSRSNDDGNATEETTKDKDHVDLDASDAVAAATCTAASSDDKVNKDSPKPTIIPVDEPIRDDARKKKDRKPKKDKKPKKEKKQKKDKKKSKDKTKQSASGASDKEDRGQREPIKAIPVEEEQSNTATHTKTADKVARKKEKKEKKKRKREGNSQEKAIDGEPNPANNDSTGDGREKEEKTRKQKKHKKEKKAKKEKR